MAKIYCSISNCHYWNQGNRCDASEIMVTSDSYAEKTLDSVDAPQHDNFPKMSANSCMETCCKTFVEKGSKESDIDGVTRYSY